MYTYSAGVYFDGVLWKDDDMSNKLIRDILNYNLAFITVKENGLYYLIDKSKLSKLNGGITLTSGLQLLSKLTQVTGDVKLTLNTLSNLNITSIDGTSVVLPGKYPFVVVGDGAYRTIEWGSRTVAPDLQLKTNILEDYTVGIIEATKNSTTLTYGSKELVENFHKVLIQIGPALVPLRDLFILNGNHIRVRPEWGSLITTLYPIISSVIIPEDLKLTLPVRLSDLMKSATIDALFNHKQVKFIMLDTEYPVTIIQIALSNKSGYYIDPILFNGVKPTTAKVVGLGYFNEVRKFRELVPSRIIKSTDLIFLDTEVDSSTPAGKYIITMTLPMEVTSLEI